MYKLLLATDDPTVRGIFQSIENWHGMGFHTPIVKESAQEAMDYMESHGVDAIGYCLEKDQAAGLQHYLSSTRPSLPIFMTRRHVATQLSVLQDVRRVLDRRNADFSDEEYAPAQVMAIMREELVHALLAGELTSRKEFQGRLQLLRSDLNIEKPCVLFEIEMPQGEVYLTDRWHYGRERLEVAMRNFFGQYVDHIYYGVAVLTPQHIRLLAAQNDEADLDEAAFGETAGAHVSQVVERIKEFLDLDLCVREAMMLDNVLMLVHGDEKK